MVDAPEGVKRFLVPVVVPILGVAAGFVIATRTPIVDVVNEKLAGPIGGLAPYATAAIYAVVGLFLFSMGGIVGKIFGAIFFGLALKAIAVDALGVF